MKNKSKYIVIFTDPHGVDWFGAYGPLTKDIKKASYYASREVAQRAAANRMGFGGGEFWNSERTSAENARKEYRGWRFEVVRVCAGNNIFLIDKSRDKRLAEFFNRICDVANAMDAISAPDCCSAVERRLGV